MVALDIFFLDGWKGFMKVCLAIMQAYEEDLLKLNDIALISHYFQQQKEACHLLIFQNVLEQTLLYDISDTMMDFYENTYFVNYATHQLT